MASSDTICAGCRQKIPDRCFLTCCLCEQSYDIECANVSLVRFTNTMTKQHKLTWKCPLCYSKMAKSNNSNTPVRQTYDEGVYDHNINKSHTQRRQAISPVREDSMISFEGDTLLEDSVNKIELDNNSTFNSQKPNTSNQITLEQINTLIQQNLQQNNKSILQAIQSTIQEGIENALKDLKTDFKQNIETIQLKQLNVEEHISELEQKIERLQNECTMLQAANQEIQEKLKNIIRISPDNTERKFDNLIVLHGIASHYNESEEDLIYRISYIFKDILNIDTFQYIEEIAFIGKTGNVKPIKIELRNKRLRKYILQNSIYFREFGLGVSEYLTEPELKQRRELNKALKNARKNGLHAKLRNNKLIINGRESIKSSHSSGSPNERNRGTLVENRSQMNIEYVNTNQTQEKLNANNNVNFRVHNDTKQQHSKRKHSFRKSVEYTIPEYAKC